MNSSVFYPLLILLQWVFVLSGCLSGCNHKTENAASTDEIRWGEVQTLTGIEAGIGIAIHQGIELAIQKLNDQGGIGGHKIQLITLDDQGRPEEAATAVTKLITQSRVTALLGASASSRSIAIAAIAQKYHIPMVTPSSTHPKVTEMGDYIFRVCYIDSFQGQTMANFAARTLKVKDVAILTDLKSDYSVGLTEFFKSTFLKDGGNIVANQSYSAGDMDFKSQLTAIRGKAPQAIYIPGYYSDVALIARQARDLGITAALLGGDGWSSPKLTEIGGRAIEGAYFSSHFSSDVQEPQVQNFVSEFHKKNNSIPNGLSALGYDAAGFLAEATKRAYLGHDPSPVNIRSVMAGMNNYPGVTGKISMDLGRNASKTATVLRIENGNFKFFQVMNPF